MGRATRSNGPRAVAAEALEGRLLFAVFVVNKTADGGAGSLRQAILDANASPGADTITFNITAVNPGVVAGLAPTAPLPTITGRTFIDGLAQPGSSAARPLIELNGIANAPSTTGLTFTGADDSVVRGLIVNRWGTGIRVLDSDRVHIESNWIGLDRTGLATAGNGTGVAITGIDNVIGGDAAKRNHISGNVSGIKVVGTRDNTVPVSGTIIAGNYIGAAADRAATAVGNTGDGIRIASGTGHVVGGTTEDLRNVIVGNRTGINFLPEVSLGGGDPTAAAHCRVEGNYIGLAPEGDHFVRLPNTTGIDLQDGGNHTVGGTAAGTRNVISGNGTGVRARRWHFIVGNWIGPTPDGGGTLRNDVGVELRGDDPRLGGPTAAERNVVSGNGTGVLVRGPANRVQGNYIGTDPTGMLARPNTVGVMLDSGGAASSTGNLIGGTAAGEGNVISGNGTGVQLLASTTRTNKVQGNLIGLTADASAALGNANQGVFIESGDGNEISGGNTICANGVGVEVRGPGNTVRDNFIGSTDAGVFGNRGPGILVGGPTGTFNPPPPGNTIQANTVQGNGAEGIRLEANADRNTIQNNLIGANAAGSPRGNRGNGITITGASDDNVVSGNEIANNDGAGVAVVDGVANQIVANSIYNNGGLGIDLGPAGVTPNDPGDVDTGPNRLQNFPVITRVSRSATQTVVEGTITPTNATYMLDFFANTEVDPSGNGEGKTRLLGTTFLNSDGTFRFVTDTAVPTGQFITATASRVLASNSLETSEFSRAMVVPEPDATPPAVAGVYVAGSGWAAPFLQYLEDRGLGQRTAGYLLPANPAQPATLPWSDLNKITVRFTEPVIVGQIALEVVGTTGNAIPIRSFTYDAQNFAATWTIANLPAVQRVELRLEGDESGGVRDVANNPMGDFTYRFNVLVGDVNGDGRVNAVDLSQVRARQLTSTASPGSGPATYGVLHDVNGSGNINAVDLGVVRANQLHSLPAVQAPAGLAFAPIRKVRELVLLG